MQLIAKQLTQPMPWPLMQPIAMQLVLLGRPNVEAVKAVRVVAVNKARQSSAGVGGVDGEAVDGAGDKLLVQSSENILSGNWCEDDVRCNE